ncbi:MAG: hypothetical protein ACI4DW_03545, partial [Lachnospiraceae bacterium]
AMLKIRYSDKKGRGIHTKQYRKREKSVLFQQNMEQMILKSNFRYKGQMCAGLLTPVSCHEECPSVTLFIVDAPQLFPV